MQYDRLNLVVRARSFLLAGCLALLPCAASAHVFCVVDAAGLQAALQAASEGGAYNGEDNAINMAVGRYSTHDNDDQPFTYSSSAAHSTYITGGGDVTCTRFNQKPTATIVSGANRMPVFVVHNRGPDAMLSLNEMTIQDGENSADGGGISVNAAALDEGAFQLAFVIVRNNHSARKGGGMYVRSTGHSGISIYNTVIAYNSADLDWGAGELVAAASNSLVYMVSDDVVENTVGTASATGGLYIGGAGIPDVNFSIFSHNHNTGLHLDSAGGLLYYVDCGTLGGVAPASAIGFTQADPHFVDYLANPPDLHLASGSPLLAAAPSSVMLSPYDIEGRAIPQRGRVDLGAYEDTVFSDGFDGD